MDSDRRHVHVQTNLVKQSSYTLVLENLVLLIDFATLEKERKESSIVVVVAVNLPVQRSVRYIRLTAAAYFKARYHSVLSAEGATYHYIT